MNVDRLFDELDGLEGRLEEMREEITRLDLPVLEDGGDDRHRARSDRRQITRKIQGLEASVTKAARAARHARRLLRPYATPTVEPDDDIDPSDDVEA